MRGQWTTLLLGGFLSFVSFQMAVSAHENLDRKAEFFSPNLTSNTSTVRMGQNVFLFCSIKNTSLQANYSLFWYTQQLDKKKGKGEPVIFNRNISKANESGPYKCKVQVYNISKYSQEFNFTLADDSCPLCLLPLLVPVLLVLLAIILILVFWIRPKYKAKKSTRVKGPTDSGALSLDSELYANPCSPQPICAGKSTSVKGPMDSGALLLDSELYANPCSPQPRSESTQEIQYATPVFQEMSTWKQEDYHISEIRSVYCELNFSTVHN
ncbi:allergin-1 [Dipodomys merriami]|uniref:allergin-1 n=1 Tax=Dipodomys merriami TaxID=94247 RepID=UPI003855A44D